MSRSKPFQSLDKTNAKSEIHYVQPDWYKKLNREWALKSKEKFRIAMTYLGSLYGFHESDHLLHSSGGVEFEDTEN